MPPLGTPSPFRVPSNRRDTASARATSRRGPGFALHTPSHSGSSQFASTPRFVFSQARSQQHNYNDGIDGSDQDKSSSSFIRQPSVCQSRRTGFGPPVLRRKETIEDPDEEGHLLTVAKERIPRSKDVQTIEDGTNLDDQFDILFPPTQDRSKRRRVSSIISDEEVQQVPQPRSRADSISSSSGSPSPSAADLAHGSSSPLTNTRLIERQVAAIETPVSRHQETGIRMETPQPRSSSTKAPFRNHLRFVFSASSDRSLRTGSTTPSTATDTPSLQQERKRPAFVLPRSPSPGEGNTEGSPPPAPFSPTSNRLRGRGRPRATSSNYLTGGMAAEVRSWILEMTTKREQQRSRSLQSDRYLFTARVESSTNSMLSSGAMILARARMIDASKQDLERNIPDPDFEESPSTLKNILLLGNPVSNHHTAVQNTSNSLPAALSVLNTIIKHGDVIGIHRGLTWELDLDTGSDIQGRTNTCDSHQTTTQVIPDSDDDEENSVSSSRTGRNEIHQTATVNADHRKKTERWLVAAEWEILVEA